MLYSEIVRQERRNKGTLGKGIASDGAEKSASDYILAAADPQVSDGKTARVVTAGKARWNFVAFDANDIKITHENGDSGGVAADVPDRTRNRHASVQAVRSRDSKVVDDQGEPLVVYHGTNAGV